MQTSGPTLWNDGDQEVGIWECTAGPSYWTLETHEEIYIISGRMTVTREGDEPLDVGAGDAPCSRWAGPAPGRSTRRCASSTSSSNTSSPGRAVTFPER